MPLEIYTFFRNEYFGIFSLKSQVFIEIICLHETALHYDLRGFVYCEIYITFVSCHLMNGFKHYVKPIIHAELF